MKIAHISDAHLGRQQYHLPEREEDYYRQLEQALRAAKAADAVVITGDLLDSRRPSTKTLLRLLELLEGRQAYVIGGNHDWTYLRPDETPLRLLDKVKAVRLLCFDSADLGGVPLFGACAMPRSKAREYRELLARAPPNALLAIHQAIEGVKARYPASVDEYTMPASAFAGLKYLHIAAGHVHDHAVRHPVGAVWAGSLELWDSAEFETWDWRGGRWEKAQDAAPKGMVMIDVAGKAAVATPIQLGTQRRMLRLRIYLSEPSELEQAVEDAVRRFDVQGAVVRVELWGELRPGSEPRPSAYEARFQRALYVDFVDRLRRPREEAPRVGSAYEAVERLLRERLGPGAEAVVKALAHIRDGDSASARKIIERWMYAEGD
ncbi:MAG: metallophosphoesterase [Thermoproteus sp. AZ2]|jgi:DNA repair exonuclease SbcCD nuclease subunit|uniref:Metallophosphoesterase n=1 Tax=Thermoproteus sp. AZ2 TaxID=1609232 RepID=A0ACC6V1U4_9CREN|nr:MAG: exonuclease SbcD [Thermoproteus sp. AZ2]